MITVWTKANSSKVFSCLSPVLKNFPNVPVEVSNNFVISNATTIILALGSEALKTLQEHQTVHKNRTVTSLRTQPVYWNGIPILISYSVDIGDINHTFYVNLLTDVGLAIRYHQTGSFLPVFGEYRWVSNFSELVAKVKERTDKEQFVDTYMDLETVGLDPYRLPEVDHPGAFIVTIQVTDQIGFADAVRFDSRKHEEQMLFDPLFREQIDFLLNCKLIRQKGANFKFDLNWLWVRGKFECTNFRFDTTIVGSLLDENRSNALDVHVKIYAPRLSGYSDHFDRVIDKSRMDLVSPEQMLPYCCGDVDGGLEVAAAMKGQLLQDPQLTTFYVNILHPASRAFEKIERGGIFIDMNAYQELKSDLEAEQVRLITQAGKILGGHIVAKHFDSSKKGGLNLTKASLLTDFMFSPMGLNLKPKMFTAKSDKDGNDRPSTSLEHLLMFIDVPAAKDFILLVEEYGSVAKTYSTYVVGFLKCLRSDGKYHPTYYLFVGNREEGEGGAVTGRLSCHDPAFQTLPQHTKWANRIRRCFPAPPGYVVLSEDYSQGELRVIACIADEDNMIQSYKEGKDLHVKTAAPFAGHTYESLLALAETDLHQYEEIRQLGKAGDFGLVFGIGVDGFVVYARQNYRVDLPRNKAEEFRNAFFKEYPKLLVYHDTYKKFAHKYKHVRSPLGRIRHLPLIDSLNREMATKSERQAINAPVQSCLTDMVLWSLAIQDSIGLNKNVPTFGVVHDSALSYCLEDKVDIVSPQHIQIMENLPFETVGWKPQLKFLADAKAGPNLGEVKKIKKL